MTVYADEAKIAFYEDLTHTIEKIPRGDFLVLMREFNAWVGRVHVARLRVIGKYGFINNGQQLAGLCASFELVVTNTNFKHKA